MGEVTIRCAYPSAGWVTGNYDRCGRDGACEGLALDQDAVSEFKVGLGHRRLSEQRRPLLLSRPDLPARDGYTGSAQVARQIGQGAVDSRTISGVSRRVQLLLMLTRPSLIRHNVWTANLPMWYLGWLMVVRGG
jgi:hypothetical protein